MAPLLINAVPLSLLLFSAAGFYTTWSLLMNNGTADQMIHIRDIGPQLLPGTQEPIKTSYTGVELVDSQLGVLAIFFWEMVDGSRPNGSLFCFYFGGQLAAGWSLLLLESLRNSNRWSIISFITLWGLAMQNFSFAVTMPIYMAIHLITSPTISFHNSSDLLFDVSELASIPFSMLIGYIVPAILLGLPSPSVLGFDTKQAFMAIWQVFPIWVGLLQQIIPSVMSRCGITSRNLTHQEDAKMRWISTARVVYIVLFFFSGAIHISTITLMASSAFFPRLFQPKHPFDALRVFLPISVSASTKMSSIGSGALQLLQYDFIVGSAAFVIWTSALLLNIYRDKTSLWRWLTQAFGFTVLTAVAGPFGYAIACIWARDELVFARSTDDRKEK